MTARCYIGASQGDESEKTYLQGLPSGDADLPHAAGDEDAGEPSDLLERQQLLSLEELEVATEDLLRHAVDAAEVAAVGDRDPQVPERSVETVHHSHCDEPTCGAPVGPPDPPARAP